MKQLVFFISGYFFLILVGWAEIISVSPVKAMPVVSFQESRDTQSEITLRDTTYLREINEQASELISKGTLSPAKPLIDEALRLSQILDDYEGEAFAVRNLANYYIDRGQPDSVISEIEQDFPKYRESRYGVQIGNQIATAHNMLGNYQRGLNLYKEMYDLAEERDETRMMIGITQNMGNNYKSLGDIPAALDSYFNSLELAEETNDTLIIAVVLDNIATLNKNEGNFELAENYLMRALEMNRQIGNRSNQIVNHMTLGGLYNDMEDPEKSLHHYDRVLELAEELGNSLARIQALYNLGMLYIDLEEYEQAEELFRESLDHSQQNNIPIGAYYNQGGLATVYKELGDYDRAVNLYEAALEVAERAGGSDMIRTTLQSLYETLELAGDTLQAYGYLRRYSSLTDSLAKTDREEALARQETLLGLRTEREHRELLEETLATQQRYANTISILLGVLVAGLIALIVFYRKKRTANIQLQKKTEELSEVNDVKDRLLSVLAHDLRTPISNIQGVLYLIREGLFETEDIDEALNQIDFQLQQGINTLTNYLQWAQNHREELAAEMEKIQVKGIVDESLREISKTAEKKEVSVHNEVTPGTAILGDVHMMRIILKNLLSNAVKYVEKGDRITVSAVEKGRMTEVSVSDTGQGIEPEKQQHIFQPFNKNGARGTLGEAGTGLGLSICKEFVEKQGGTIRFESEPGKGTRFTITLKKAEAAEPFSSSLREP